MTKKKHDCPHCKKKLQEIEDSIIDNVYDE